MQLLPMASSPDGLTSAQYAVITKTPSWEVFTTTSNVNVTQGHVLRKHHEQLLPRQPTTATQA